MPAISRAAAVDRLASAVRAASADDLVEVYRELYPAKPISVADVEHRLAELRDELLERICGPILAEQIVDVWNVVFPVDSRVWFDDDDDAFHYQPDVEPAGRSDW